MSGRPRAAELFAGVGGFRLGLEPAGFDIVWSNQWEPSTRIQHASSAYVARFGAAGHDARDIATVLDEVEAGVTAIPDHDLLVGGFPCQDYSVAKPKNAASGIVGKKGVLWWEIHRLLRLKRPSYLLLENVDRLLKSPAAQRGRDFGVMLSALAALDYAVEWRVINAADYGFPQKRRRVFIVAQPAAAPAAPERLIDGLLSRAFPVEPIDPRTSRSFDIPADPVVVTESFGATAGRSPFRNAGSMVGGRVWTADLVPVWDGPRRTLGDVLEPDDAVDERYFIADEDLPRWRYLKGAKREPRTHRGSDTPYLYSEGALPFPDRTDIPARTILTGEAGRSPSRFKHVVRSADGRYRRLTPRELERLNGFPDDWTDTGMPEGRRGFAMGNALVVGVVERIAHELRRAIDEAAATR